MLHITSDPRNESEDMPRQKKAVVAGALGITGRNLVRHLSTLNDWDVLALSRRVPDYECPRTTFVSVDLLDRAASVGKLAPPGGITHAFFCAYAAAANEFDAVDINLRLLSNFVESVESASLERLVLVEGAKWYGGHLGPYRTPAKEGDPRHMPPNFYYDQEDYVRERAARGGWTWTAVRPSGVCGFAVGNPMNLSTALAVYCVISKELGLPLRFPGKGGAYNAICEMTDADHLARALVWAGTHEPCSNEAFNITNGDFIRWRNVWPKIASFFDMPVADPQQLPLSSYMSGKAALWATIVAKHGLQTYPYGQLAAWPFLEALLSIDYDIMSDTVKAREFGFTDVVDTTAMFPRLFTTFRKDRIIP